MKNIGDMTDVEIDHEIALREARGESGEITEILGHLKHARNMRYARKVYERRKRDNGLD